MKKSLYVSPVLYTRLLFRLPYYFYKSIKRKKEEAIYWSNNVKVRSGKAKPVQLKN